MAIPDPDLYLGLTVDAYIRPSALLQGLVVGVNEFVRQRSSCIGPNDAARLTIMSTDSNFRN